MLLYYVTPKKRELFKVTKEGIISLSPQALKNPLYRFQKRVLILGKEWIYYLRRRFPPLSERDLRRALANEIPDLFSLKDPAWVYTVLEKGETYVEVGIFAWEKALSEEIKKEFPFSHLIPEELLFVSKEPALFIIEREEKILLVASEEGRYLNSLLTKPPLSSEDILLLLRTLKDRAEKLKKVVAYGITEREVLKVLPENLKPYLTVREDFLKDWPEFLRLLQLKKFTVKEPLTLNLDELLLRAGRLFLAGVIALQVNLLLSYWEYTRAIKNITWEIKQLETKTQPLLPKGEESPKLDEEKIKALRELEEEFNNQVNATVIHPLSLLDELARILPDGSKLERFSLKERKLELFVISKDLFEVLTNLRKNPRFSQIRLASSPMFDSRNKIYRFRLELELK
ncbi:MAG: PilN domain-containing protein [Caldimicrobium sp.]